MNLRCIVFLFMALLGLSACSKAEDFHTKAILGASELALAFPTPGQAVAAAGSLQAVLFDPYGGPRVAIPFCSGFMVSHRHMMTASHCVQREFIFNQSYVSAEEGQLSFVKFGKTMRLNFVGRIDPQSEQLEATAPVFKEPVFMDRELDIAIFDLGKDTAVDDWINIESASDELVTGELYAYPNGAPLTRASCTVGRVINGSKFMHDCDAMSGSSGGLIVSLPDYVPVAMHLAGPGANDADYHESHGVFESPEVFAGRHGCKSSESNEQLISDCIRAKGYNRGVTLSAIARLLKEKNPALWQSITEQATSQTL